MGMRIMPAGKGGPTMSGQTTAHRGRTARETVPEKDKKPSASRSAPASPAASKPARRSGAKETKTSSQPKISILIVDDHPVFRGGLRGLLELDDEIQVVGEAQDGQQALDMARELTPQVILMDVNLPIVNGLQATRELTAER